MLAVVAACALAGLQGTALARGPAHPPAHAASGPTSGTKTTYAGTITYSRSFTGVPADCGGTPGGTESDAENWTVTFSGAYVGYSKGPTVTASIAGSDVEHIDCPGPEVNETFDWNETTPGTFGIDLADPTPGEISIHLHDYLLTDGLSGTMTQTFSDPSFGGPYVQPVAGLPLFGQDHTSVTVPATGGPTTVQTAVPWRGGDLNTDEISSSEPGTLTVSLTPTVLPAPVAHCDAYWVTPNSELSVPAPGLLGNDVANGHGALRAHVEYVSFGTKTHPYSVDAQTGAVNFKATQPGTATITYYDVAADRAVSEPTTATIYIEPTRPKQTAACGGSVPAKPGSEKKQSGGHLCPSSPEQYLHTRGTISCTRALGVANTIIHVYVRKRKSPGKFTTKPISGFTYLCYYDSGLASIADSPTQSLDCFGNSPSGASVEIDAIEGPGA